MDEDVRRAAQINLEHLKSFIARRRWKVQMQCESRSVRTVTTKYTDSEGNVKSKRRAELSGKSVVYEGEYSETDSEAELNDEKHNRTNSEGVKVGGGGESSKKGKSLSGLSGLSGSCNLLKGLNLSTVGVSGEGGSIRIGIDSIKLEEKSGSSGVGKHHKLNQLPVDVNMMRRQKVMTQIPNIELKPIKVTEFNEAIDENSDNDENDSNK